MKKCSAWWVALALAMAGCSAKKHLTEGQYYSDATEHFRGGALTLAIDDYHNLLDQYPFSEHNEEAELRIAHAQYLTGNYAEAVVALTDFQRRHPTSTQLPLVGYYLGMCYVQQMGTIDRDQTAARNAQTYFQTLMQQYPDSPFSDLAGQQLAHCQESLAAHEFYVARFYERNGNTKAAEIRLLMLASRYGETDVAVDGLLRLAGLYRDQEQDQYAALAYRALTQLHPRAPEAVTANRELEQLAPGDPPAAGDPIDLLLAANGRQRSAGTFEPVTVPGLEPARSTRRGPSGAPPAGPAADPFGRGRGRPY
jgi:outer membrane protein assembly factor BamD